MTKTSEVRVGLVQMTCGIDPLQNLERSIEKIPVSYTHLTLPTSDLV